MERTGVGSFLSCGVYRTIHFIRWLSARDFLGSDCIVGILLEGAVAFVCRTHCRSVFHSRQD
jgi:hypothetical protein